MPCIRCLVVKSTEDRLLDDLRGLIQQEAILLKRVSNKGLTCIERGEIIKQLKELELQKKVKGKTLFTIGVSMMRIRAILFG